MPVAADHPVYSEVTDAPCAAVPRPVDQRVDQPVGTHPARSAYSGFAGLDDVGESSTDTAELWMTGMSRQEATAMLTRAAVEGGFLVRPSSNSPSGTAVSVGPRHAHAWCSMLPRGNCERARGAHTRAAVRLETWLLCAYPQSVSPAPPGCRPHGSLAGYAITAWLTGRVMNFTVKLAAPRPGGVRQNFDTMFRPFLAHFSPISRPFLTHFSAALAPAHTRRVTRR